MLAARDTGTIHDAYCVLRQAGDEEHNPLAQYDDLEAIRQAEVQTKRVVCLMFVIASTTLIRYGRNESQPGKRST